MYLQWNSAALESCVSLRNLLRGGMIIIRSARVRKTSEEGRERHRRQGQKIGEKKKKIKAHKGREIPVGPSFTHHQLI